MGRVIEGGVVQGVVGGMGREGRDLEGEGKRLGHRTPGTKAQEIGVCVRVCAACPCVRQAAGRPQIRPCATQPRARPFVDRAPTILGTTAKEMSECHTSHRLDAPPRAPAARTPFRSVTQSTRSSKLSLKPRNRKIANGRVRAAIRRVCGR